jgi:hypothetical protein
MELKVAQILSVAGYGAPILDLGTTTDWTNGILVAAKIDYDVLDPDTAYMILNGYGNGFFGVLVQGDTILEVWASSTSFSVELPIAKPQKMAFYCRKTGTRLQKGLSGSITYHVFTLDIYDETGKIYSGNAETRWLDPETPRFFTTLDFAGIMACMPKVFTIVAGNGPATEQDINDALRLLDGLHCDSQTALSLVNAFMPKTEPKDLFNAVVSYLTDFGGQDPQDVIATLREIIGAVYPITAGPIPETRTSGVMVGIYEQGPTTITEKGPLLEFSQNVAIEVQAPDDSKLFEVLDFIERTISFLNWKTPALITQRRVWHQNETDVNRAYAFCVSQIKTYKWR